MALVHEAAHQLAERLAAAWPTLEVDWQTVLLAAATHDVGKVIHRGELTGPGSRHETAGPRLLREHGFPEVVARIARTHGRWRGDAALPLEDLLVALADAVWKGQRDDELERRVVRAIAAVTGEPEWSVHVQLDDSLTDVAAGADRHLAWYASQPV